MEYLQNEMEEVNGVGVVGKRRENASRKTLAPPNPGRARGRALWSKSLEGLKSKVQRDPREGRYHDSGLVQPLNQQSGYNAYCRVLFVHQFVFWQKLFIVSRSLDKLSSKSTVNLLSIAHQGSLL